MGKAWTLSRGAVLALIAGSLVIFLLEFLANLVIGGVAGLFGGAGKAWGSALSQVVDTAVNAPLFAGLVLYVYRRQRGEAGVAATFS
jgi:hypothetical protein